MDKYEFIEYLASRYGIDGSVAETVVGMFSDCLQELISAGQSVNIDEIGEFKTYSLFPKELQANHPALIGLANTKIVNFNPSTNLTLDA